MHPNSPPQQIREEDLRAKAIERRAFLGRFVVASGVAGLLGSVAGCAIPAGSNFGQGFRGCDSDSGDTDSDVSDSAGDRSDGTSDPCDADSSDTRSGRQE